MNIYQYGDTVRFQCTFYNFEGEKIDPQMVKVVIYDQKYKIVAEHMITSENKKGVGEYFYDYTTPSKAQKLYYEWYGEIDGTPSLRRGSFMTKFI
ncbi:hypothetical protein [Bacillus phage vB_BanS-Thrax1]|nr:hypothetical protein [Bacillus phage vB_BanS-Thrax1]